MSVQHAYKGLGRSTPSAATPTTLYTAPASTSTLLQNLHICNTSSSVDDQVRVYAVPSGGGAGVTNAVIYDMYVPVGNPFSMDTALVLATGDFVSVYSLNGTSTFTLSGVEIVGTGPQTLKSFGRATPAAAGTSTLYTATGVAAMLQSLHICNTGAGQDLARVYIVPSAGSAGVTNAIIYDMIIPVGNPFAMNTIPTLNASDFVVVYSRDGNLTFTAAGLELS